MTEVHINEFHLEDPEMILLGRISEQRKIVEVKGAESGTHLALECVQGRWYAVTAAPNPLNYYYYRVPKEVCKKLEL